MKKINKNIIATLAIAVALAAGGCTKRGDLTPEAPSKFTPDVTLTSPGAFQAALLSLTGGQVRIFW
jgi:hypothetical protein